MARDAEPSQWIVPTRGSKTLPAVEILTGRGFITGKSGSGKSNTGSVIAEELLENSYNLLVIDPEGEYYGLKEQYELLHVGNDENLCDVKVGPEHGEKLATIAIEKNVPVIVDVSEFLDGEVAKELIVNTVKGLYAKEKDARKPFLLIVEEMQEYLPQKGSTGELGEVLERVAKRGRKRGLGMLGMSQRPSSVDKDFITQCDWMVWHRLNWKNDLDVVRNILGPEIADEVEDLDTGEGYLMTDWDEDIERVQFKKKRTHDAGATPGLESYERPDLKSVSSDLVAEIKGQTVGQQSLEDDHTGEIEPEDDFEVNDVVDGIEALNPSNGSTTEPHDEFEIQHELEELEEAELRETAEKLRSRNQILEDEVRELRSILKDTEQPPTQFAQQSADPPAPAGEVSVERHGRRSGVGSPPDISSPTRPQPPKRPPDRKGVSGNLIEFTQMSVYLMKSISYRVRLLSYKLRSAGSDDGRES
jgi:hypothetical protein